MNDEERRILTEIKALIKLFLLTFSIMAICFTVAIVTVSCSWAMTVDSLSNDYFYSDYDTVPVIEQKVDVRSGE